MAQDRLTKLAKDRPCMIRLPGICYGDERTTVLAHFRLIGISGMGLKPNSLLGAWACRDCHQYVDTHKDPKTQLDFCKAVFRTQAKLIEEGEIQW